MSCPLCGATEECRCSAREFQPRHVRRPRFQPDEPLRRIAQDFQPDDTPMENEPSELSEQQFAASLNTTSSSPPSRARFVVDNGAPLAGTPPAEPEQPEISAATSAAVDDYAVPVHEMSAEADDPAPAMAMQAVAEQDGHRWRDEVAERVHNYRVRRRRRAPRYPSLSLKFEAPEQRYLAPSVADALAPRILLDAGVAEPANAAPRYCAPSPAARAAVLEPKIIEFPKPVPPPLPILDVPMVEELAEPIVEGPRILDAPETLPQTPPLGGITLEQPEEPSPALELPLQVAPVAARGVAALIDGAFVLMAGALFAWMAFNLAKGMTARTLVEVTLGTSALFWAVYHYVLITYSGTTPGMEMAQIRVSCFDGDRPSKRTRRGRALAMVLSAVSFGLGYLWCLFDEDTLCWHDRITRTYTTRGPKGSAFARVGAFISHLLPQTPRS